MNAKQRKFAREYLKHGNGTKAALAAGYGEKGAAVQAHILLRNPKIQAVLGKANEKADVTVDNLTLQLRTVGYSNVADYIRLDEEGQADIDLSKCSREQLAAVQEITVDTTGGTGDGERRRVLRTRLKLIPKIPALELLARRFTEFSQKQVHSGSDGGPVKVAVQVNFVNPPHQG